MKFLVIALLLVTGCTSSDEDKYQNLTRKLKEELIQATDDLNTCNARLEVYSRPDDIGGVNADTDVATTEPEILQRCSVR